MATQPYLFINVYACMFACLYVCLFASNGLLNVQLTANSTHIFKNHETRTEQEKWLRKMCKPCLGGLLQPSAGLTCGKQQAVSNRQHVTRAQGQLQLGFTKLSLSISEHLGVTSHCHR